ARDAAGNSATSSAVTVPVNNDTAPPVISGTTVSNISSSGAAVSWTTNELSDSQVEYGPTTAYGSATALDGSLVTSHTAMLNGLAESTVYHYRVKSRDAAGNLATSGDLTFTTLDRTPPIVSMTAPASGSAVAGTVTATANASDNVGVAGVQFRLDGADLGAEVTVAPYSISWNTTTATDASHALTAVARDAAGNKATSAGVTVTVSNASVSVAPSSVSFGSVTVGTTSGQQDIQITNTGSAGASVNSVNITGPFAISQNYCLATGTWNGVMAPGTKCDILVALAPVAGGNASGTLNISAAGNVYPVTLSGTAAASPASVSVA